MRYRIWAVIGVVLLAVALSSCITPRAARGPVITPVPTKTLRPTFTHTPAQPTMTAAPTVAPATATPEAPAATPEPPTAVASPTSEVSRLTAPAAVNVRSGPGTNYAQIGRLQAGQSFVITGKNPASDWWQFDFNGRPGWVLGELVRASGGERVQVAANIAPPPTARPRPTARPVATAAASTAASTAAQPPAAANQFAAVEARPSQTTNDYVTVRCRATNDITTGRGQPASSGSLDLFRHQRSRLATQCWANTGMDWSANAVPVQRECKVDYVPSWRGPIRAVLVDGGGKQISDPISFTPQRR